MNTNLLSVQMNELHVHRVNRGEDIGASLDDALPGLGHCDRRTGGQKYRFVAAAQR